MVKILGLKARQVLDSRGNPTVECELSTSKGDFASIVPSGASTGKHEALELRDKGREFGGKGVLKAVANVNRAIAKKVQGKNFTSQEELDRTLLDLDGTPNKSSLGANAMLSVSMSFARSLAAEQGLALFSSLAKTALTKKLSMPVPQLNVINGGKHAGRENDVQEHMFLPLKFRHFDDALRAGAESYHALKAELRKKLGEQATLLGDEGGFAPSIDAIEDRLELMLGAIEEAGYKRKISIALDCASSEFYSNGVYKIGSRQFSSGELVDFYSELVGKFGIVSIEDGMAEDDWAGWQELSSKLGSKLQLVGDDLLVTSTERIYMAAERKACNALLLKVNQIGTITESIEAAKLARRNGWNVIVSHRSGESEDPFIADLCVALAAEQCKFGAPARGERTAKYNRLLRISENLG